MSGDKPQPPGDPWPQAVSGLAWEETGDEHPFDQGQAQRYLEIRRLGRGGMGDVFEVEDQRLGRRVALKALRTTDPELEARLAREARITAGLEHPAIVGVHDAGRRPEGHLFYTMRLVRGRTLEEVIRDTPAAERLTLVRPFLLACEAVAYAHERGVIHRDLKPANILLAEHGDTVVADWGLAKELGAPAADGLGPKTTLGTVLGTPAFMAPEQARGEPADRRSDVWSLGATLYAIVTGRALFVGDSSEVLLQLQAVSGPPSLEQTPAALRPVLSRALSVDPDARYADAGELVDAIAGVLDRGLNVQEVARAEAGPKLRFAVGALAVALLAGVASTGVLWQRLQAEEGRKEVALEAARQADDHLQRALVGQGLRALEQDARAEAEVLAAHALQVAGDPEMEALARGILSAWDGRERPELVRSQQMPECEIVELSRDGSHIACARDDGVELLRTEGLERVWRQSFPAASLWFAGNQHLMVFDATGQGAVLDLEGTYTWAPTHRLPRVADVRDPLRVIEFNGDGDLRVQGKSQPARYELAECERMQFLVVEADGTRLSSCKGGVFVSGPGERRQLASELPTADGRVNLVWTGELNPQAGVAVVGTLEGWVEVFDLDSAESLTFRRLGRGMVKELILSEDGQRVVARLERGGLVVWDLDTDTLTRLPGSASDLALVGDRVFQVGDGQVREWRLPRGQLPHRLDCEAGVTWAGMSTDGEWIGATCGHKVQMWRKNGQRVLLYEDAEVRVQKDGVFEAGTPRLLTLSSGQRGVIRFDPRAPEVPPETLYAQGGRRVGLMQEGVSWVASWGAGPNVWQDGEPNPLLMQLRTELFEGETDHSRSTALFLDIKSLRVFRLKADRPPQVDVVWEQERRASALAVGERGAYMVLAGDGFIERVDLEEQAVVWSVDGPAHPQDVAISVDESLLAVGEESGSVRVHSLEDGALVAILEGHGERAYSVEFSPDGQWLLSGSWDDQVRIWSVQAWTKTPEQLLEAAGTWGVEMQDLLAGG